MASTLAIRLYKVLILSVILACLAVLGVPSVHAAVTLVSFDAIGEDGEVLLLWETATEIDNAGFYVQRGLSQNGTYDRIGDFIPSTSDGLSGATYEYTDDQVVNGTTYWYRLESVEFDNTSDFSQPVSATPGPDETPTPTITASTTPTATTANGATRTTNPTSDTGNSTQTPGPTNTATPTSTLAGNIYTRTPTRTTNPAYPAPATTQPVLPTTTAAPTVGTGTDSQVAASSSQEGAATLIPLPSITFSFPANSQELPQAMAMAEGSQANLQQDASSSGVEAGQVLFIGVILMIWVILGGWFFLSVRKLA